MIIGLFTGFYALPKANGKAFVSSNISSNSGGMLKNVTIPYRLEKKKICNIGSSNSDSFSEGFMSTWGLGGGRSIQLSYADL